MNACVDIFPYRFLTIKTTLYFFSLKKSDEMSSRSPDIPFCNSLNISPLCHTLSKALEISKKTLLNNFTSIYMCETDCRETIVGIER